jgi:polyferredoxin
MRRLPVVPSSHHAQNEDDGIDVLRWPLLGTFLRWRHARRVLQLPFLALAAVLVIHGLFGSQLAPKNLATVVVWVHYRGALVLALIAAGNVFCGSCPFLVPRDIVRRWWKPRLRWPRALRSKWLAVALLVGFLFGYELFDWWSSPRASALLLVSYFVAAFAIDSLFAGASFCKYVCPIGQFNFTASTISPLEIRVRDHDVCSRCATRDCIRGTPDAKVRGCELSLFQPRKHGNVDCTFCLDCVHACPHDNIAIASRLPGSELSDDPLRSGVGRFSRRRDLAALAVVFTFGALLNAFGMVSPVYAVKAWIGSRLHLHAEAPLLATLFALAHVIAPAKLIGAATFTTRLATGSRDTLTDIATRFAYTLVPIGLGVWTAHYSFHFLTGLWTFVPVAQRACVDVGYPLLGEPRWTLSGIPRHAVYPMEMGFLGLGLVGSCIVAWRIAEREHPRRSMRAFVPWVLVSITVCAAALWLLSQPMEMRGTLLRS